MLCANTHNAKAMPIIAGVGDSGANLYKYEYEYALSSQSNWEPCSSGTCYIKSSSTYSRYGSNNSVSLTYLLAWYLKYYVIAL